MSLYNTDDLVQALFPDISGLELVIFPKCDQLHTTPYSSNLPRKQREDWCGSGTEKGHTPGDQLALRVTSLCGSLWMLFSSLILLP